MKVVLGMNATVYCGSDRVAYTIIDIDTARDDPRKDPQITLQRQRVVSRDDEGYAVTAPNPDGETITAEEHVSDEWITEDNRDVVIGIADDYFDMSF